MKLICFALLALAVFAQDYVKIPTTSSSTDANIKAIRDFGATTLTNDAIGKGKIPKSTYKVTRISSIQTQTLSNGDVNYKFVCGISSTGNTTYLTATYIVGHIKKTNNNTMGIFSYTSTTNSPAPSTGSGSTSTGSTSTGSTSTGSTSTGSTSTGSTSTGSTSTTKPTTSSSKTTSFSGSGKGPAGSTPSATFTKLSSSAYRTDAAMKDARDFGAIAISNTLLTAKKIAPGTFDIQKISGIQQLKVSGGVWDRFQTTFSCRSNLTYIVANYTVYQTSANVTTLGEYTYTVYTNATSVTTTPKGYDPTKKVAYTYEGDVANLIAGNFDRALEENEYVFVKFWLNTCPNCKMWKQNYTDAIDILQNSTNVNIFWTQVEDTDQPDLFKRFSVSALPTNWLFVRTGNVIVPYDQPRRTKYFVQWIKDTYAKYEKIRTGSA